MAGLNRSICPTCTVVLFSFDSSTICFASATSLASGFSIRHAIFLRRHSSGDVQMKFRRHRDGDSVNFRQHFLQAFPHRRVKLIRHRRGGILLGVKDSRQLDALHLGINTGVQSPHSPASDHAHPQQFARLI